MPSLVGCAASRGAALPVPASGASFSAQRAIGAPAGGFKVIYAFGAGASGYAPTSPLIRDSAGNLYGTTYYGGNLTASECMPTGCGVVFKIDPAGKESVVHAFAGPPSDGQNASAGLLEDGAGNLYGTTLNGGNTDYGTVFKIDTKGKETLLHSFCPKAPNCSDGADPDAALIMDASGNLYGTTEYGGSTSCKSELFGCGAVFKLDKTNKETVLHAFQGPPNDGRYPLGDLLEYKGVFYGTTYSGGVTGGPCGTGSVDGGCGIIFRVTAARKEKVLHEFKAGTSDGGNPVGSLIMNGTGTLYGTATIGGSSDNGVVFSVNTAGKEKVVYNFGGGSDGAYPRGLSVSDSGGNLYGTTELGGSANLGTVFAIKVHGRETVLHSFSGSDGAYPNAELIRSSAGTLYGSASQGGSGSCTRGGCGTVFKL